MCTTTNDTRCDTCADLHCGIRELSVGKRTVCHICGVYHDLCGRNEWFELEFGSNFWMTCVQPQMIQDVKVVLISMVEFGS